MLTSFLCMCCAHSFYGTTLSLTSWASHAHINSNGSSNSKKGCSQSKCVLKLKDVFLCSAFMHVLILRILLSFVFMVVYGWTLWINYCAFQWKSEQSSSMFDELCVFSLFHPLPSYPIPFSLLKENVKSAENTFYVIVALNRTQVMWEVKHFPLTSYEKHLCIVFIQAFRKYHYIIDKSWFYHNSSHKIICYTCNSIIYIALSIIHTLCACACLFHYFAFSLCLFVAISLSLYAILNTVMLLKSCKYYLLSL